MPSAEANTEANKAIAREYFEAFANGDLAWLDDHIAADFVRHDPGLPFEVRGPEGVGGDRQPEVNEATRRRRAGSTPVVNGCRRFHDDRMAIGWI